MTAMSRRLVASVDAHGRVSLRGYGMVPFTFQRGDELPNDSARDVALGEYLNRRGIAKPARKKQEEPAEALDPIVVLDDPVVPEE